LLGAWIFFAIISGVLIYFMPSFIAMGRKSENSGWIFLVNLLIGWTCIGWVVAFIWSLTSELRAKDAEKSIAAELIGVLVFSVLLIVGALGVTALFITRTPHHQTAQVQASAETQPQQAASDPGLSEAQQVSNGAASVTQARTKPLGISRMMLAPNFASDGSVIECKTDCGSGSDDAPDTAWMESDTATQDCLLLAQAYSNVAVAKAHGVSEDNAKAYLVQVAELYNLKPEDLPTIAHAVYHFKKLQGLSPQQVGDNVLSHCQ
jgi:Tfp pilus assembly protein PilV